MHSRPRIFHRKLYYRLIVALERHIYANPQVPLVLYAKKTAKDLERFYDRHDRFPVLYLGLDHDAFNPVRRAELRNMARGQLGITNDRFILLLVGNSLPKKGIVVLIEAISKLRGFASGSNGCGPGGPGSFSRYGLRQRAQGKSALFTSAQGH